MPTEGKPPNDSEPLDPLEQPPLRRPSGSTIERSAAVGRSRRGERDGATPDTTDSSLPDEASDQQSSGSPAAVPPVRGGGRLLGLLSLLVALAALVAAGWLYYRLVYEQPVAAIAESLEARVSELEAGRVDRQELLRALEEVKQTQAQALTRLAEAAEREREQLAERLLTTVNEVAARAPPTTREWKIAEVAYLLRIANYRLLMERDRDGALMLLRAADAILEELDDFALFPVRARLAEEMLALESTDTGDLQGLFLRLEAVKDSLSGERMKLPRLETTAPSQVDGGAQSVAETEAGRGGFWAAILERLGDYVRIRRFDEAEIRPLLAPQEAYYLELNLRLMLERAQLAALRRDQLIFEESLAEAMEWMNAWLDSEDPAVAQALAELEALRQIRLDQPLPDISGSLTALQQIMGET